MHYFSSTNSVFCLFLLAIFLGAGGCAPEPASSTTTPAEPPEIQQVSIVEQIDKRISKVMKAKDSLPVRRSLMFGAGDYVFDGTVYSQGENPVIVEENGQMGEQGYIKRRFVLEEGELIFIREEKKMLDEQTGDFFFRETRYYYHEGQFFRALSREAEDVRFLSSGELQEANPEVTDFAADLQRVQDAVEERGAFALTFQELIELSGQSYLLLGSPFSTSLRVISADETIEKLRSDPSAYQGKPMKVRWEFRILEGTKEAVYLGGQFDGQ